MLSLQNIRDGVRKTTGEDESDLPNTDLDILINKAFWEISDKLPFRVKQKTVTFDTLQGAATYDVPSNFDALRSISLLTASSFDAHVVLTQMSHQEYEASYIEDSSAQSQPTKYLREANCIRLWPTPDGIYTVTLKYDAILADLTDTNNYPPLPQVWGEIIEYGASWRRFREFGDYQRLNQNVAIQRSLIASTQSQEAKELKDNKLAGLQVVREDNY